MAPTLPKLYALLSSRQSGKESTLMIVIERTAQQHHAFRQRKQQHPASYKYWLSLPENLPPSVVPMPPILHHI